MLIAPTDCALEAMVPMLGSPLGHRVVGKIEPDKKDGAL